eukprot:TRINITY_DN3079_c3_g4_i1.p1 TRINITY_DN3079_c3_g4~~TRINITY_DN3079_c3_g4_i1.p1  ORF type:complete len:679 (+),score=162.71 TRINITY_DN3079_c3_g4_i1:39-2039(+)
MPVEDEPLLLPHNSEPSLVEKADFLVDLLPHFEAEEEEEEEETQINIGGTKALGKLFRERVPRLLSKGTFDIIAIFFLLVLVSLLYSNANELTIIFVVGFTTVDQPIVLKGVVLGLIYCLCYTTLQTIINYLSQKFYITWRRKLVTKLHSFYFANKSYYILQNGSYTLDNPDQRLTTDVTTATQNFCDCIFGNVNRDGIFFNIITIAMVSYKIVQESSFVSLAIAVVWFLIGVFLNSQLMSPVVKVNYRQNQVEGDFRFAHVRVRTYAESVAFYKGESREHMIVEDRLKEVVDNFSELARLNVPLNFANLFIGQFSNIIAFIIPIVNVFVMKNEMDMADVNSMIQLITQLLTALSAILSFGQDISVVMGSTTRVAELMEYLETLDRGEMGLSGMKQGVFEDPSESDEDSKATIYIDSPKMVVDGITVSTPQGRRLINNLKIDLSRGNSTVIQGPSGCGKSSILRAVAGLWDECGGKVYRPGSCGRKGVFFIPQRPYIVIGTLRDQLCYPYTSYEIKHHDSQLLEALEAVDLGDLPSRGGGLDSVQVWEDMLSLGEQQRLGFARMFFHHPSYAILDESTASLDEPLETKLYTMSCRKGITLISVAHRSTAVKYHKYKLLVDKNTKEYSIEEVEDYANIPVTEDISIAPFAPAPIREEFEENSINNNS